jgi:hypothetical protein
VPSAGLPVGCSKPNDGPRTRRSGSAPTCLCAPHRDHEFPGPSSRLAHDGVAGQTPNGRTVRWGPERYPARPQQCCDALVHPASLPGPRHRHPPSPHISFTMPPTTRTSSAYPAMTAGPKTTPHMTPITSPATKPPARRAYPDVEVRANRLASGTQGPSTWDARSWAGIRLPGAAYRVRRIIPFSTTAGSTRAWAWIDPAIGRVAVANSPIWLSRDAWSQ